MSPSSTVGGYLLSLAKISDASSHTSHVCHADFLPFPRKADTISQPVELWKNRIPLVLSGPRATAKSCTGIHLKLRPCPNAIFSYSRPRAWKTTDGYHQNIRVTCFDHDDLAALCCCLPGMHEDPGVRFFLAARGHPFQADCPVANNILLCIGHKLPDELPSQLWMFLLQSKHVFQMHRKPPCVVYIVVCKQVGEELRQRSTVQLEVGFSKCPDE